MEECHCERHNAGENKGTLRPHIAGIFPFNANWARKSDLMTDLVGMWGWGGVGRGHETRKRSDSQISESSLRNRNPHRWFPSWLLIPSDFCSSCCSSDGQSPPLPLPRLLAKRWWILSLTLYFGGLKCTQTQQAGIYFHLSRRPVNRPIPSAHLHIHACSFLCCH